MLVHFFVSRTTKTQFDHGNKIALVQWRDAKLVSINLVHLQGNLIGATRSHDLHEGTLADHGAPADHSKILVRRTDCYQLVQMKSVGGAHPPLKYCTIYRHTTINCA